MTIALILEILLGFNSKSLKLDHDMTITLSLYQLGYIGFETLFLASFCRFS